MLVIVDARGQVKNGLAYCSFLWIFEKFYHKKWIKIFIFYVYTFICKYFQKLLSLYKHVLSLSFRY